MKYQPPFDYGSVPGAEGIHNATPSAPFVNGDPVSGAEGSIPPAEAFEHPQREIVRVITDAALVPDHQDLSQLSQAIKKLARAEVRIKGEGGGLAVYHDVDPADQNHRVRSLRAGTNVTIEVDTDGALKIAATGGGGGGGANTGSGLGVLINGSALADLAFDRIPAGTVFADPDRLALRRNADGLHITMTIAQLKELIGERVTTIIEQQSASADKTDVLHHLISGVALHTFSPGTPIYNLPDINLARFGGRVGFVASMVDLVEYGGSLGYIFVEASLDNFASVLTVGQFSSSPFRNYTGATPTIPTNKTASFGVSIGVTDANTLQVAIGTGLGDGQSPYEWGRVVLPAGMRVAAVSEGDNIVCKLRLRTTCNFSPARLHGFRLISDLDLGGYAA